MLCDYGTRGKDRLAIGRGFVIKSDYYNGINLAYLLNVRGALSTGYQAIADFVQAERVRHQVIKICSGLLTSDFFSRTDRYWIVATLEEAYYGVGNTEKYEEFRAKAEQMSADNGERRTTRDQLQKLAKLLENSPLV